MDKIALFTFLLLGALGHAGLVVWAYNSINATGFRRTTIKRIEKLILVAGLILPAVAVFVEFQSRESGEILWWQALSELPRAWAV